jgi:hypothetical protein
VPLLRKRHQLRNPLRLGLPANRRNTSDRKRESDAK